MTCRRQLEKVKESEIQQYGKEIVIERLNFLLDECGQNNQSSKDDEIDIY